MELQLAAKGTVTPCREKLNSTIAALPMPETQENQVVRMIAHFIVAEYLDPLHDPWQAEVNALRAARLPPPQGSNAKTPDPPEPVASFVIDCKILLGG